MKKIVLVLAAFAVFFVAQAQNATKAKYILDKVAAMVSSPQGVSARFTITAPRLKTTQASVSLKGSKLYVKMPEATIWSDGKTQWVYMKSTNEVNIQSVNSKKMAEINPYQFINLYKKGYALSMKTIGSAHQIRMKATSSKADIKDLYIWVNSRSNVPTQVKFLQGGAWKTIKISGFKRTPLPNSLFVFNPKQCPGAEIIDLR